MEPATAELVNQALHAVVKRLQNEIDKLNRLDAVSGDADTGTAFARAADTLARDLTNGKIILDRPSSLFRRLGLISESRVGGTCGASKYPRNPFLKTSLFSSLCFSLWSFLCCCCEKFIFINSTRYRN